MNITRNRFNCPQEVEIKTDRRVELPHECTRKEKQNLCMHTHDEYFESYPVEKTTSGTTYSSPARKQAEDIVNVGQSYVRVVDDHGTESCAKFQMCKGLGQDKDTGKRQQVS